MSLRPWWWLATFLGIGGGAVLGVWARAAEGPVVCLFRRAFDLPCPGCGMTRALGYLARGELGAAVTLHPLAPLVAAEIVAGWLVLGLVVHGKGSPPGRWWLERCLAASGFFLLAVWMGRLAIGDLNAIRP